MELILSVSVNLSSRMCCTNVREHKNSIWTDSELTKKQLLVVQDVVSSLIVVCPHLTVVSGP